MAKVVLKFNPDGENAFDLDDNDIVSLDSLSQSTPDASGVNYGCIANTGSASLIDYNGNIANMIESGELPVSNLDIEITINGNKIEQHYSTDSDYNASTKEFSISMTNKLEQLGNKKYSGYSYKDKPETLLTLLEDVMSNLTSDSVVDMMSDELYSKLQKTTITYPYIQQGRTYRDVLDEFCTILQCSLDLDTDNKFKFVSARPIHKSQDNIINLPNECLFDVPSYSKILKNKYDGVTVPYSSVKKVNDDTIFTSKTLYIYENETYVAENSGINPEGYNITLFDVSKPNIDEYGEHIKITYVFDLSSTQKIRGKDISAIKLRVNTFKNNFSYNVGFSIFGKNESTTISTGSTSTVNTIEAINYFDPKYSPKPSFTKSLDGNELTINLYIDVGGLPAGGYSTGSHPYSYPQTVNFEILDTTYNFESTQLNWFNDSSKNVLGLSSKTSTIIQDTSWIEPDVVEVEKEKEWEYYQYLDYDANPAFTDTFENGGMFAIKYHKRDVIEYRQWTTGFDSSGVVFDNWFGESLPYTSLDYSNDYYNGDYKSLYERLYPNISKYFNMTTPNESKRFKSLDGKIIHFKDTDQYAKVTLMEKTVHTAYHYKEAPILYITQTETPDLFNTFLSEIPNGNDGSFSIILKGYKISLRYMAKRNFTIPDTIKTNILEDYKNGISSGTVKTCPINLYYTTGNIAKNWNNGEVINVNDLIVFENIDKVWRVTGRKFVYEGEPLIELEYQESNLKE